MAISAGPGNSFGPGSPLGTAVRLRCDIMLTSLLKDPVSRNVLHVAAAGTSTLSKSRTRKVARGLVSAPTAGGAPPRLGCSRWGCPPVHTTATPPRPATGLRVGGLGHVSAPRLLGPGPAAGRFGSVGRT